MPFFAIARPAPLSVSSTTGKPASTGRMPRILLVNERGGGWGHASRLGGIAAALAGQGAHCTLMLKSRGVDWARRHLHDQVTLGEIVVPTPPENVTGWPCDYGQMLAKFGFTQVDYLTTALASIDRLVAATRPDLIIADYAPLTLLACAGRIPAIWTGNSFTTPPPRGGAFPPFWPAAPAGKVVGAEQVLPTVSSVLRGRNQPAPSSLAGIFGTAMQLATSFAEFDPYRRHRRVPLVGTAHRADLDLDAPRENRVLAYLPADFPQLAVVLAGLVATGRPVDLHCPGLDRLLAEKHHGDPNLRLLSRDLVLPRELAGYGAVVSTGGALVEEVAINGLPQLAITQHVDAHLRAAAAARFGIARHLRSDEPLEAEQVAAAINHVAESHVMGKRAKTCAQILRKRHPTSGVEAVARCTWSLLSRAPGQRGSHW